MNCLPPTRLRKKLLAVTVMLLTLHTQVAWTCNGVAEMDRAPCCGDHGLDVADRNSDCEGDPSTKLACANPLAPSGEQPLVQGSRAAEIEYEHPPDGGGHPGTAIVELADLFPSYGDPPVRLTPSDPYPTLASARLTYLKTHRLRI
ncbi:MAG: hypothetical protein ACREQ8_01190 [Woeseiaceae bacterium]